MMVMEFYLKCDEKCRLLHSERFEYLVERRCKSWIFKDKIAQVHDANYISQKPKNTFLICSLIYSKRRDPVTVSTVSTLPKMANTVVDPAGT